MPHSRTPAKFILLLAPAPMELYALTAVVAKCWEPVMPGASRLRGRGNGREKETGLTFCIF